MSVAHGESLPKELGKGRKHSSRVVILVVVLAAVLIIAAVAWIAVQSAEHTPKYVTHKPISITGNGEFTEANGVVGGSGTPSDPYVIEGWDINAASATGIQIQNTTASFVVRSCFIHDEDEHIGLYLSNCTNGMLVDNTCSKNGYGIELWYSSNNTLDGNNCSNNGMGMYFYSSSNNTLVNNTCNSNVDGMFFYLWNNDNIVIDNNCSLNSMDGMILESSSGNVISWNQLRDNSYYGIEIDSGCTSNVITYNVFIDNHGAGNEYNSSHAQAVGDGVDNRWNITEVYGNFGNYWSDWTTPDANQDMIVDLPYNTTNSSGGVGTKDYYPLTFNPLKIMPS